VKYQLFAASGSESGPVEGKRAAQAEADAIILQGEPWVVVVPYAVAFETLEWDELEHAAGAFKQEASGVGADPAGFTAGQWEKIDRLPKPARKGPLKAGDWVRKERGPSQTGVVTRFIKPKGWKVKRAFVMWPPTDDWVNGSEQYVDVDKLVRAPRGKRATPNPKTVRGRVYVHRSALSDLDGEQRRRVTRAAKVARVPDWDVARVDPDGGAMVGRTTSWGNPNPELVESWLVRDGEVAAHRNYRVPKRPKYHKTALMLPNPAEIGSGATAIARDGPSAPVRSLYEGGHIEGPVLDFGSGRGEDAAWLRSRGLKVTEYDPNFEGVDTLPSGTYATVLCIYVLNVLPKAEEERTLRQVRARLRPNGVAYVAVRSDVTRAGRTSRGYQRPVRLDAERVAACAGCRVFRLER